MLPGRCFVGRGACGGRARALAQVTLTMAALVGCSDDLPQIKRDAAVARDARAADASRLRDLRILGDGVVTAVDGSVEQSCVGKSDGVPCSSVASSALICVAGACVPTRCGDGYIDRERGEECDPGKEPVRPGCSGCHFDCRGAADCDDQNPCNGAETCATETTHACVAGTPPSGETRCTVPGGNVQGLCRGGACAVAGCGDKLVQSGEECDDGNQTTGDGCESNCRYTCKADADCSDGNACTGEEKCGLANHLCLQQDALVCNDGKACTVDSCEPASGCLNQPLDADKDGKSCADDCNDADPAIYKGALEYCDNKDNDCNGLVDDGQTVKATCFADGDGDSFAPAGATSLQECVCPTGYTLKNPATAGQADCYDRSATLSPAQNSYFTTPFCTRYGTILPLPVVPTALTGASTGSLCLTSTWDYNCDKVIEKQYPSSYPGKCTLGDLRGALRCAGSGWTSGVVPECGTEAQYTSCGISLLLGGGCMASKPVPRTQACR